MNHTIKLGRSLRKPLDIWLTVPLDNRLNDRMAKHIEVELHYNLFSKLYGPLDIQLYNHVHNELKNDL